MIKSWRNVRACEMRRKLLLSIVLVLVLSELGTLNSTIPMVSAAVSPYIAVVPESTVDSAFTPGMNYTISIYTDYDGDDVNGYGFELTYDPSVLEGIEVVNGDLINVTDPDMFASVGFNNTVGRLKYTNNFLAGARPFPLTSGPGTLAKVTFRVVARGTSNITLEDQGMLGEHAYRTRLYGYLDGGEGDLINIIDSATMPDHIQHGFFDNRFQHNVAVGSVIAPVKSVVGELVPINVTVANLGAFNEVANVTIRYDTTYIDSENVTLAIGASKTVSFSWNTTDLPQGLYTINATATIEGDLDLHDNKNTAPIILVDHDVAVVNITALETAVPGELVPINVTVANLGTSIEVANVTIRYDTTYIDSENVTLAVGASKTVSFSWNTTGISQGIHTINATATIDDDGDLTDNWNTTTITLVDHDVAVVNITALETAVPGELVPINVTVANLGTSIEVANVTIRYDTTYIDSENVTLAVGASKTVSFSWNTTGISQGIHTINATATIDDDGDLTDNWNTTTIILAMHDVAVEHILAPTTAHVGEIATIRVSVANLGWYNETFEVEVTYDTSIIENPKLIDLLSGASDYVDFSWNTTGVSPGSYTITAKAILATDEDSTNNLKTKSIVVNPPGVIAGTVTDASNGDPIVGASVTADGHTATTNADGHYSITDVPAGTYTVTAEATGYHSNSTSATVFAGNTTTVDFALTPLPGAIAGTVTDASNGDPIVGASVTADGHTATTNADGHYSITDVPAGTYTVTASATGYESASQHSITVAAGDPTTVNFALRVSSTISISVDLATITVGKSTTISGSITPALQGVNVIIQYRLSPGEAWTNLTTVTTNEYSQYSFQWTPETADTYEIKALWPGDENASSAESDVQTITVQELPSGILSYPYAVAIVAAGVAAIIMAATFYFLRIRKPKTK